MASKDGPKKVRIACQRCRIRRIKCDAKVPACGNCAQADVPCIDVDGRNGDFIIPRNFAAIAKSRINWLESIIREYAPHINLSDGPQIDLSAIPVDAGEAPDAIQLQSDSTDHTISPSPANTNIPSAPASSITKGPLKRGFPFNASETSGTTISSEVHSVATDLGMLSLNSDSRQQHYIGSSSGLLFTSLIGLNNQHNDNERRENMRKQSSPRDSTEIAFEKRARVSRSNAKYMDAFGLLQEKLRSTLPTRDDALYLFKVYLRRIHPEHPFLHPQSILNALDALYECVTASNQTTFTEKGWPRSVAAFEFNGEPPLLSDGPQMLISMPMAIFHVFMVFTLASTMLVRAREFEFAPIVFYRTAIAASAPCFSNISLASLQGLLLLTVRAMLTPAELNMWTLTHMALAYCIDLGMHRESKGMTPLTLNIRRLVFYITYSLDRSISTIQGRPLGFRDETFDVSFPEQSQLNESIILDTENNVDTLSYGTLAYTLHRFRLDMIVSQIKQLFYRLPKETKSIEWPKDMGQHQSRLYAELQLWCDEIPGVVSALQLSDEYDRDDWSLRLKQVYYATVILLFQPSQAFPRPSDEALLLCFRIAVRQVEGHHEQHERNVLYPGWRIVQNIFSAGSTIVYCFWVSQAVQLSNEVKQLPSTLRMCSNLLVACGEWWPSAKRGQGSFAKIMDVTLENLNSLSESRCQQPGGHSMGIWDPNVNAVQRESTELFPGFHIPPSMSETPVTLSPSGITHDLRNTSDFTSSLHHDSNRKDSIPPVVCQANFYDSFGRTMDEEPVRPQTLSMEVPTDANVPVYQEVQELLSDFWTGNTVWNHDQTNQFGF